jgi:hypothetical protein
MSSSAHRIRELDQRSSDGVEVTLLWDSAADRVFIAVEDKRRETSFQLEVDPADALDAFHHPYAYVGRPLKRRALAA